LAESTTATNLKAAALGAGAVAAVVVTSVVVVAMVVAEVAERARTNRGVVAKEVPQIMAI
jgi:hypothetical protein